jgi:hypothetical protein
VRTTASPISRMGTSVGEAAGSLAERHDAHQHDELLGEQLPDSREHPRQIG